MKQEHDVHMVKTEQESQKSIQCVSIWMISLMKNYRVYRKNPIWYKGCNKSTLKMIFVRIVMLLLLLLD
jgi:hypothetical protein